MKFPEAEAKYYISLQIFTFLCRKNRI